MGSEKMSINEPPKQNPHPSPLPAYRERGKDGGRCPPYYAGHSKFVAGFLPSCRCILQQEGIQPWMAQLNTLFNSRPKPVSVWNRSLATALRRPRRSFM